MNPGHLTSSVLDIPLERIRESRTKPRRTFDEAKLVELAANIKLHDVLQPILVRPLPDGEPGFYELVAGARRYRASRLAERKTIPASVRELTDAQCLELQLIENLHGNRRSRSRTSSTKDNIAASPRKPNVRTRNLPWLWMGQKQEPFFTCAGTKSAPCTRVKRVTSRHPRNARPAANNCRPNALRS
jgi:hypothetical protein